MTRTSHNAWMGASLLTLVLATGCSEGPITPPAAVATVAPSLLSRRATPSTDRHVMDLSRGIPADLAAQVAAKGGTLVRVDEGIGMAVTSGLSDADAESIGGKAFTVRDLNARWVPTFDEMKAYVDPMPIDDVSAMATPKSPLTALYYVLGLQWNMQQVQADAAWALRLSGRPSVRVAILDTGLDPDHIDQNGTVIDKASSTFFTPSLAPEPGPRWMDDHFHGTHVGGTVTSNNIGVAGLAPNVTLVAVKVLNASGSGSFADVISGIYYATNADVQVINLSIGAYFERRGPGVAQLLRILNNVINYAHAREVLVVSGAGNENVDLQHNENWIFLPCEAGVQMCISATGRTNAKASYSNYGTDPIDVAAPGGDVDGFVFGPCNSHSIDPRFAPCKTRNRYLGAAGTSQAAPHVAALGAYLYSQSADGMTASQMITAIQQHADDLGKPGTDAIYGKGRINVLRTLIEHDGR